MLVWYWHKQAITGHTGSPCFRCVQRVSHKDTEEEVGQTVNEILAVLQKYSRPVVVVVVVVVVGKGDILS